MNSKSNNPIFHFSLFIVNLCREPLLHFLLIGAALFFIYDLKQDQGSVAPQRIVVSTSQVEQLSAQFERTWMRPPTDQELTALIENHIREEVFYREALAMGLDQNDPLVRRRMRMKLEYMLEDLATEAVKEEDLSAYLQAHPEKFRTQAQLTFKQVYLNPDKHQALDQDAEQLLADLKNGTAPQSLGDPGLVPNNFTLAFESEISRTFGKDFAQQLLELSPGEWIGPLTSPYGVHFIKVDERIDARIPELADVRKQVEREYLNQRRQEQKELAYQKLRENYKVTIESIDGEQEEGGGIITAAQAK